MKRLVLVGLACAAVVTLSAAPDPLSEAKDLYAAAAYEDALSTLAEVDDGGVADVARQVAEYRAFCLYALGRTTEAESVAEALIRRDPLVQLGGGETSPRIEAMFTEVRKRLLPTLIREAYRSARATAEQKDPASAEKLVAVQNMLSTAQKLGAWNETLADLSVLVDGFIDLSKSAPAPRAAGTDVPRPPSPAASTSPAAVAPPSAMSGDGIYGPEDEGIVGPVVLSQAMPRFPQTLAAFAQAPHRDGVMQILIDEKGMVEDGVLSVGLHPTYDHLVMAAMRTWRYRPATKAGVPVKYRKVIILSIGNR
jgi:hypothetical protein